MKVGKIVVITTTFPVNPILFTHTSYPAVTFAQVMLKQTFKDFPNFQFYCWSNVQPQSRRYIVL